MPEPLEKLETLYAEWADGDYSRSDMFHPDTAWARAVLDFLGAG